MKSTPSKETLTYKSTSPNGKVTAVHAWATGNQVLEFDSRSAFDKAKKSMEGESR